MELFKNTNFDFLGKKWPFIIASLVLTVAGLVSLIAMKGGPRYGIDFRGGTLMTVKFPGRPPVDRSGHRFRAKIPGEIDGADLRSRLERSGHRDGDQERARTGADRATMVDILQSTFGQPKSGKLDFNNASQQAASGPASRSAAEAGVSFRKISCIGLAADIAGVPEHTAAVRADLELRPACGGYRA